MVLPAIILILGVCLQAVSALGTQLSNASLARQAAQELSRGVDVSLVSRALQAVNSRARFHHEREGELVCVILEQAVVPGPLEFIVSMIEVRECVIDAH